MSESQTSEPTSRVRRMGTLAEGAEMASQRANRQRVPIVGTLAEGAEVSAEDLERYETEIELQLYQEYRAVLPMFRFVVETERRFYLANDVRWKPRARAAAPTSRSSLRRRLGVGHVPAGPFRVVGPGGDLQGRQRRGASGEGAVAIPGGGLGRGRAPARARPARRPRGGAGTRPTATRCWPATGAAGTASST